MTTYTRKGSGQLGSWGTSFPVTCTWKIKQVEFPNPWFLLSAVVLWTDSHTSNSFSSCFMFIASRSERWRCGLYTSYWWSCLIWQQLVADFVWNVELLLLQGASSGFSARKATGVCVYCRGDWRGSELLYWRITPPRVNACCATSAALLKTKTFR